ADVVLQGNIDDVQADVDQNEIDSDAADDVLQDNINTEIQDRIDAVANEANIRSNADILLNNRITNETNRVNGEIVRLDNRIDNVKSNLESSIDKNSRGIAMVAAMTNTRVEAGKCHGVDFNLSNFRGETGFAFGYANRVNENVQVHGAIASTTDFDESVVRVGVSYQW
ncbi:MAG: YadA C-terminal domain-containing protein, partial [Luteolibacter sp.]